MPTITIINERGLRVPVVVDSEGYTLKKEDNVYCLTCGIYHHASNPLLAHVVSQNEGLKGWLERRSLKVQFNDTVLLCHDCKEEYFRI